MRKLINIIESAGTSATVTLFHGGSKLEQSFDELRPTPSGRGAFGGGIYLATNADSARKYAKGSRKLYEVTVEMVKGAEIRSVEVALDDAIEMIKRLAKSSLRKEIINDVTNIASTRTLWASTLNNLMVNYEALTAKNSVEFRKWLISRGVQYSVDSGFGGYVVVVIDPRIVKGVKHNKDAIGDVELPEVIRT